MKLFYSCIFKFQLKFLLLTQFSNSMLHSKLLHFHKSEFLYVLSKTMHLLCQLIISIMIATISSFSFHNHTISGDDVSILAFVIRYALSVLVNQISFER